MKSRVTVDSSTAESFYKVNAGILLGEDLAFQAKEAGSNPTTRSTSSARSSVGLEHLPSKQTVGGSNPSGQANNLL